ncbi:MAG: CpaF family protein [Candidatus Omnitrophota bacterium]
MEKFEKLQMIKTDVRTKVLARVKKSALDYRVDEGAVRRQIEAVLESVVQSKMDGQMDDSMRRYVIEEVINEIFGLGPIDRLINDPAVWEIMVNGPREVYVEREGRLQKGDVFFENEAQLYFYIERILSPSGRRVSEVEPYIDARLPDGSRINVVRQPIAPFGPVVTIRKANRRILGLTDLISRKTLDERAARFLRACVKNQMNIVIAGGPGAGKTTLLNMLTAYIPETERVITIEDTMELHMENKHCVAMETRPANIEGRGEITIRELVRNALHMRPDRVIIGEVRGEEALDMLQCMNIGRVGSMTTMHANSGLDALLRLETMAMMGSNNVSSQMVRRQIISAIDLVITSDRLPDGARKIMAISEVAKDHTTDYLLKDIFHAERRQEAGQMVFDLKPTGHIPAFLEKFLDAETVKQDLTV